MISRSLLTGMFALASLASTAATAQRRPTAAPAPGAPPAAAPTATTPNPNLSVVPLALPRTELAQLEQRFAPNFPQPKNPFERTKRNAIEGNQARNAAADTLLNARAQALVSDALTTVVVVIGKSEDRDKVVESLAHTTRKVVVAHVDKELADATYDNTIIASGMKPAALLSARNMWIYLPRTGGVRQKPNDFYPVKMASEKFWTTYFGIKGDGFTAEQLTSLVARDSSAAPASQERKRSTGEAPSSAARPSDSAAAGDVVISRIASLKLYSAPGSQGSVVGTASKSDELLVMGLKEGFLQVQGNMGTGWVSAALVSRQK